MSGARTLAAPFAEQLRPLGTQLAPFVEGQLHGWRPYRNHWNYEDGCIFKGCLDLAEATGARFLSDFVLREVAARVAPGGTIAGFDPGEFNIDNIHPGKTFFRLLALGGEARFRLALDVQFQQLERHPRTASGNYWHKQIYPWQVWLDGLYMAHPFQLAYARLAQRPALIEDTRRQFAHVHAAMRDAASGLYFHGWDERRLEKWSDPRTGCSPCFWGRAMGWFVMALVDCLEALQDRDSQTGADAQTEPTRALLQRLLIDTAAALLEVRSPDGLWYQVLDQRGRERNYEETSASLMFAYAFMKAARLGWLAPAHAAIGRRAFDACVRRFLSEARLDGICGVAGLGNVPYRDGSYDYYVSEPIVPNDPKGVGALFMAASEAVRYRT